jgi:hypothetical protein
LTELDAAWAYKAAGVQPGTLDKSHINLLAREETGEGVVQHLNIKAF